MPIIASASDGLDYAGAYYCNADVINQDLVETCSRQFPELTQSASDALARWRSRVGAQAQLAHATCEKQALDEPGETRAAQLALFHQHMDGLRLDIKTDFRMRAEQEGKNACVAALEQFDSVGGPLDFTEPGVR